jgi:putative redox protein
MAKHFDIKTVWKEGMVFENHIRDHVVLSDALPELGQDSAPGPKELVLSGLASCTGMDVVSLLCKMRVDFTGLEIRIETQLTEEYPRVFDDIKMKYIISGKDLDKAKVEKAITLSYDKYCGVSAMLKKNGPITYSIEYAG